MKISFDNLTQMNTEHVRSEKSVVAKQMTDIKGSYNVVFDGKERVGFGIDTNATERTKGTLPMPTAGIEADVQNMRNQMTIMSHTMSDEDFARMQKAGYDPSEMDPKEAVTILDKIKSELVKAGVHIEGYTDSIDEKTLAAAVGSESLARDMMDSFARRDIPADEQNVERVLWAIDMAERLAVPTQDTYYFMAMNEMSATLKDFYVASASGTKTGMESSSMYFGEAVKGYITKNVAEGSNRLDMDAEVDRLLAHMGVQTGEEVKAAATWLIDNNVPVDKNVVQRMKDILAVSFPLSEEHVINVATAAIADGVSVEERNLTDDSTYVEKAVAIYDKYHGEQALNLVQDRLQLEEIRLHMTVETNLKLLKSEFAIDTAPIEETIEALKWAEQELEKQYFPHGQTSEMQYAAYKAVQSVIREIPQLPLVTVGNWMDRMQEGTLREFHETGKALAAAYEKAGERYEILQTAPRGDLGDSIRKAFVNVDEILTQNSYEITEENRKALRIISYNHMEITEENMERVKQALETVERVVHRMTPAATLKMIRDGVNPLEETLPDLEHYFEQLPQEYSKISEKYSRFLYRMEHAGELTAAEKNAFIGCYRLINQIEKTDGAAIGALINSGGELNFRNLLSAVRSGKFKGMDIKIDDTVGALSEEAIMKLSISEQIENAYHHERAVLTRERFSDATQVQKEIYDTLERGDLEKTPQSLLAARALEGELLEFFEKRENRPGRKEKSKDREIWSKLDKKDSFIREYSEAAQSELIQIEEATVAEADSVLDVRDMQLLHKQMHIIQKLASAQEYYFPMEIGGEVTGVHLRIQEEEELKGLVQITLESLHWGKITGALQVQDERVEGYFVGNKEDAVMNLRKSSDKLNKSLGEEWKFCEVEFIYSKSNHIPMDWTRKSTGTQVSNDSLYRLSKKFLQALKAVGDAT